MATISGIDEVLHRLRIELFKLESISLKGLRAAALVVKNESVRLTPVDTSNLRNSAYTETFQSTGTSGVEIGYTADYAPYVHERIELSHAPPTQAKFLEEALKRNEQNIIQIVARISK